MKGNEPSWLAACFVAGAGIMMLELTAPRLMQPWFGASTFVWTNVIGILLLALSLGYVLGGRLASRPAPERRVGLTLSACGVWTALVPLVLPMVSAALLPDPGTLAAARSARTTLELGSLAVTLLLVAPPVFVLGTVSPQVVAVFARGRDVGSAAGRVFMLGTLGSLLGTFLPTYVLVPTMGSRGASFVAAGFLVLSGLLLLAGRARVAAAASGVLAIAVSAALLDGRPLRAAEPGEELIAERESAYQYLRVTRGPALGDVEQGVHEKLLRINEGLAEFHSVAVDGESTTAGKYYDYFAMLPSCFPPEEKVDVLVLGSGAGTMTRVLRDVWGRERFGELVNVEIDPGVVALEAEFDDAHFGGDWTTLPGDGRAVARTLAGPFDLIFVDAYARQIDIPFHMATVEFFALVRERLSPHGIVALNVSGSDAGGALPQSLAATLRDAGFPRITLTPVVHWGNMMMWTSRDGLPRGLGKTPAALKTVRTRANRFTRDLPPDGAAFVLRDDHAPVEWLTDRWLRGAK